MIYFDNAATSYPKPKCVHDAVSYAMEHFAFNAGRGSYDVASNTQKMIDDTRNKLAALVGKQAEDVIFTSSATEALNSIIYGLNFNEGDNVYVSPFEHNAIVRTLYKIKANVIVIPFDDETWTVDYSSLEAKMFVNKPKAVFLSQISNVTGFELPYNEIFAVSSKFNAVNVLDAAQGFGVQNISTTNVDLIVFAGHKSLHAIFGIAGFITISNVMLDIIKVGGTGSDSLNSNMPTEKPYKYEAGSPNSIAIYALNCSVDFLSLQKFDIIEKKLTKYLIDKLNNLPNCHIYLPINYISHGIVSFNIDGYTAEEVGEILGSDYDICVRTGYHCAPFVHDFIHSKEFYGTVRVSFNGFNTVEEIDILIDALKEL